MAKTVARKYHGNLVCNWLTVKLKLKFSINVFPSLSLSLALWSAQSSVFLYFNFYHCRACVLFCHPLFHFTHSCDISFGDGTHLFIYLCRCSVFFWTHIFISLSNWLSQSKRYHDRKSQCGCFILTIFWFIYAFRFVSFLFCMKCALYFSFQPNLFNIRD